MRPYSLFLLLNESFLVEMARILHAEYVPLSFDKATEDLYENDKDDFAWELRGELGVFTVWVERYESYLSCSFLAEEPQWRAGKELMWNRFIDAGGNPDAAKKP